MGAFSQAIGIRDGCPGAQGGQLCFGWAFCFQRRRACDIDVPLLQLGDFRWGELLEGASGPLREVRREVFFSSSVEAGNTIVS